MESDKIYGKSPVEVELKKVKDKKKLPPMVEIKILTDEEKKKLKKEMTELAKSKLNMEEK